jgi:hypothetical protein
MADGHYSYSRCRRGLQALLVDLDRCPLENVQKYKVVAEAIEGRRGVYRSQQIG